MGIRGTRQIKIDVHPLTHLISLHAFPVDLQSSSHHAAVRKRHFKWRCARPPDQYNTSEGYVCRCGTRWIFEEMVYPACPQPANLVSVSDLRLHRIQVIP
jgi:hypothetical protein